MLILDGLATVTLAEPPYRCQGGAGALGFLALSHRLRPVNR